MTGNQVVSTMFNIKSFIHMARIVAFQDHDEHPELGDQYFMCFTEDVIEIIWICKWFQYNHRIGKLNYVYIVT